MNISKSSFFSFIIIFLSGLVLQCLSILSLYKGYFFLAILLHIILPLSVFKIASQQKSDPLAHKLWILLAISSFFLNIIGTLGWFITFILSSSIFEIRHSLVEYKDYIHLKFTREEILRDLTLEPYNKDRLLPPETGELAPYFEILQGNDVALKLSVIDKLSLMPSSYYINILKNALADKNDEVKLSAATNLRKIEDKLSRKIMELQKELRIKPNNDQIWAELGLAFDEYAFSGILDPSTTTYYRQQAIDTFTKAISINPFSEKYYNNLGRILIREDKIDEAIQVLEEGRKINPKSQSILLWLMEYHFYQKDFEAVREIAAQIPPDQIKNERLRQVVTWWHHE